MWDDEDGFFYDVLRTPDGWARQLKVRSVVGLLPLCAATVMNEEVMAALPELQRRAGWFVSNRPRLVSNIHDPRRPGYRDRRLLSLLSEERLRRVLSRLLDEDEFLSPYGVRSLSRYHQDHPYRWFVNGGEHRVDYEPGESASHLFGGNSNWRGPIWFPVNFLLIESLQKFHHYWGDDFRVECPTGSGQMMTLWEVAAEISRRLTRIFLKDEGGARPVNGSEQRFQEDPNWRDLILFYEYFHGDTGAGLGASHQTGWTALVAKLMQQSGE